MGIHKIFSVLRAFVAQEETRARVSGAFWASIYVPVLALMTDQDFLRETLELFSKTVPHVVVRLITTAVAGAVGYVLYKIDPKGHKDA